MKITCQGEDLYLLPEKALYWPKTHTLIVADIHLGKAAAFRSFGIPVPEGCMQKDLLQLQQVIDKMEIQRCIVVGDLIHSKQGLTPMTLTLFQNWLAHTRAEIHLVLGNHDRALEKALPDGWNLICHSDKLILPPFVFKHHPHLDPDGYVWSGHLHPCTKVVYGGRELKLPTFIIGFNVGILPAFSSFVSGIVIPKKSDDCLYPIAGNKVFSGESWSRNS